MYLKWVVDNEERRQTLLSTTCRILLTASLSQLPSTFQHLGQLHKSQQDSTDGWTVKGEDKRQSGGGSDEHTKRKKKGRRERKGHSRENTTSLGLQGSCWNLRVGTKGKAALRFHTWAVLRQRMKAAVLFFPPHIHFPLVLSESELISTAAVCNPVQHGPGGID